MQTVYVAETHQHVATKKGCAWSWETCAASTVDDATGTFPTTDIISSVDGEGCYLETLTTCITQSKCSYCDTTGFASFLACLGACILQFPLIVIVTKRTSGMTDTRCAKFSSILISCFVDGCLFFSGIGYFLTCYHEVRQQEGNSNLCFLSQTAQTPTLTLTPNP